MGGYFVKPTNQHETNYYVEKFFDKELTSYDLNDTNKYDHDAVIEYIRDNFVSLNVALISEFVDMTKNNTSSTLEFDSISSCPFINIIYRDSRAGCKYLVRCSGVNNYITIVKDNKYVYRFASVAEMRGYFHFQDQITELKYLVGDNNEQVSKLSLRMSTVKPA